MKKLQTEFIEVEQEVGEEKYWEMLEVLPPERIAQGGFLVGEPVRHNEKGQPLFDLYIIKNGKYCYAGISTAKEFDLMTI